MLRGLGGVEGCPQRKGQAAFRRVWKWRSSARTGEGAWDWGKGGGEYIYIYICVYNTNLYVDKYMKPYTNITNMNLNVLPSDPKQLFFCKKA